MKFNFFLHNIKYKLETGVIELHLGYLLYTKCSKETLQHMSLLPAENKFYSGYGLQVLEQRERGK